MINLIIGLAVGVISATVLGAMWWVAERLRQELDSADERSDIPDVEGPRRS